MVFLKKLTAPFFVAEISGNHKRSLRLAEELVEAAAEAGADAVKFQSFTPDSMVVNKSIRSNVVDSPESPWFQRELYDLYCEAALPYEWHETLFRRAESLGLIAFSSPFSSDAVDMLEGIGCPMYKIASLENTDTTLLKKAFKTGKPVMVSTGSSSLVEIAKVYALAEQMGVDDLALLKCVTEYPARPEHANVKTIPHMAQLFPNCVVGFSDHSLGIGVPIAAIAQGAMIIEKHICGDDQSSAIDSKFSISSTQFKSMVDEGHKAFVALGEICYRDSAYEMESLSTKKRSLYFNSNLDVGESVGAGDLVSLRPGLGLSCEFVENLIGLELKAPVRVGQEVTWDVFKKSV